MSIYRALQPTRFVPRLFGAAPYKLSDSTIRYSRYGKIWSLIQIPIIGALMYRNREKLPTSAKEIKMVLVFCTAYLEIFMGPYSLLKDGLYQNRMIKIIQSMNDYDERTGYANEANGKRENERIRILGYAYTATLIILAIPRYCAWNELLLDVVTEILTMQIDNSVQVFAILTTLLGLRFRHLNSIIEDSRITIVQEKLPSDSMNPENIRILYTSLVETAQRLNDHYTDRVFLWSAILLLGTIMQFYFMITENMPKLTMALDVVRFLPMILGLVCFPLACQFTADQANKTASCLLEKSIRHTARIDRGRKEFFTLSLYMALHPFEFTALGFFSVDFSLVSSVVTATITYLTLALQSSEPAKNQLLDS